MDQIDAGNPDLLAHYEGLVRKTAARYVGKVQHDYDDICQILRIKVWKALLAWDPGNPQVRSRVARGPYSEEELRDRFVFMCVRNQGKDLTKRRKPDSDPVFIEDFLPQEGAVGPSRGGQFEARYLSVEEEDVFSCLEEGGVPAGGLTNDELRVVVCMYLGYSQAEMALRLRLSGRRISAAVREVRRKFSHLDPSAEAVESSAAA